MALISDRRHLQPDLIKYSEETRRLSSMRVAVVSRFTPDYRAVSLADGASLYPLAVRA